MKLAEMQTLVVPGVGIVSRTPGCLLVVGPIARGSGVPTLVTDIVEASAQGETGRSLARLLAHRVTTSDAPSDWGIALLADDPDGMVFLVAGSMVLRAEGPNGTQEFSGLQTLTLVDGYLDPVDSVQVQMATIESVAAWGNLIEGWVSGSGAVLVAPDREDADGDRGDVDSHGNDLEGSVADDDGAKDAEEGEDRHGQGPDVVGAEGDSDEGDSDESDSAIESVDLRKPVELDAKPLDIDEGELPEEDLVPGILCKVGHFNHPDARYCAYCGIQMVQRTKVIVHEKRPSLGIVVFGDGSTYILDADYVVGRDPSSDPRVESGEARSIRLPDESRTLGRSHLSLNCEGWEVFVVDASINGTDILTESGWRRLIKGEPTKLDPGAQIRLGDYSFTYSSHHRVSH